MGVASPVRLLVLDADGTVLTSEHKVAPTTRRAIRKLRVAGVGVVLASSRGPAGLRPIMSELGVTGFAIAYQGALICKMSPDQMAAAEVITEARLPVAIAEAVFREARGRNLSVTWHVGEAWYVSEIDAAVRREARITGQTPIVADIGRIRAEPHKLLCVAGETSLIPSLRGLATSLPDGCAGHFSHQNYLEVTRRGADKAGALEALGRRLGVGLQEMAAIGDGENDAAMLREAGLGIAMRQAPIAVRDLADWITESNDQDGIAAAVERLISEGRIPGH